MARDKELDKVVESCTMSSGRVSWIEVAAIMDEKGKSGSTEMWRSRWRRQRPKGKRLVSEIGVAEVERRKAAGENLVVWFESGELWCETKPLLPIGSNEVTHLVEGREVKIAVVSDVHGGSKKTAWEELQDFYEYAHSQGVVDFYNAGDITDGMYKNRDNSFYEQNAHGFQEQLDMVVAKYPRIEGCNTYFITGNHDVTHLRNGGADLGKCLDLARDDMFYLGHNFAKVWLTENCDMNLIHPTDGSAISMSYKLQKIIDNAEGARKSKIVCVGHYHKMLSMWYKGVYGLLLPSFQRQTDFMRDNNLKSYVGGYILTIKFDVDGNILSIIPEYRAYDM